MLKVLFFTLLLFTIPVRAQNNPACLSPSVCVSERDMAVFIELLREKQCFQTKPPVFTEDSITVIVDRDGRVYGSGNNPVPHKLKIDWCNYQINAESNIQLQVAQRVEPTWGFRFRPKATFGILVADLFRGNVFHESLDGGILIEPFYVQWVNANAYIGIRSLGAGLGVDLTKNFGAYVGWSITWGFWRSNPYISFYFAF